MKKILIAIGDAGAGHISCANAVSDAIKEVNQDVDIQIIDLFSLSSFTKQYNSIQYLVSKSSVAELIFNISYRLVDKSRVFSELWYLFSMAILYKPTLKLLKEMKPDLIICNNALTAELLARCKKKIDFKYVITIPDLITVARWWASPKADLIFSPTQEATERILQFCPECKVVTGYYPLRKVPTYTKEELEKERKEFCKKVSFTPSKDIILITGCGVSTISMIWKLGEVISDPNYQIIILTGKDEKLKKKLEVKLRDDSRVYISGYTQDIFRIFAISDLVIAKPGPATVLELEKLGKKAIFTKPVGYQEFGNVKYLVKNPNFIYIGTNYGSALQEVKNLLEKENMPFNGSIKDATGMVDYLKKL